MLQSVLLLHPLRDHLHAQHHAGGSGGFPVLRRVCSHNGERDGALEEPVSGYIIIIY